MSTKPLILAFTGKKGSGKSSACEYIKQRYDALIVERINFKDALVREVEQNFPDLLKELAEFHHMQASDLLHTKPYPKFIRNLLVNYGTEVRRCDDPFYWVNAWKTAVSTLPTDIVLNDDTRFINEAHAVREMHGFVIRVEREGWVDEEPSSHVSETEMDRIPADYVIRASNLQQLHDGIDAFLSFLI